MPNQLVTFPGRVKLWIDDRFHDHPYGWGWVFAIGSGAVLGLWEVFTEGLAAHLSDLLSPEQFVFHFGLPFIFGASAARHGKKLREQRARAVAEAAVAQSEAKHRALAGNIPGVVYRMHLRGARHAEFFNAAAVDQLTGFLPEELPAAEGIALGSVVDDHGTALLARAISQAVERREPFEVSYAIRRKDGTRRDLLDRGTVVCDIDGPAYIDGVALDITELRRAQEELRMERDFAGNLIDTAPVIVLLMDSLGHVVHFNKYTEEIVGRRLEEVRGRDVAEFLAPEERSQADDLFAATLRDGASPGVVSTVVSADGQRHEIAWHLRRLGTSDAGDVRVMAVGQDVTEVRAMQEQLRQADKMQALGQLAGGIAHDFNNQLSGILGYSELLRDRVTGPTDKLRGYAESISTAARRAADLTSKLLAFARKGKYRTVPVNVHEIVTEALAMIERSIDRRITVTAHLRADPPVTMGDPTQLQNAVLNLALNARDAMPDGGTLTVETDVCILDTDFCRTNHMAIPTGSYVLLSVTDTGCGMTPDTLQRIFEPFFTTKAPGMGTGMGLAAVYGTMKTHQGAVHVRSAPGAGSSFTLYLPLSKPHASAMVWDTSDKVARGSGHVLVVDDEDVVRDMIVEMLAGVGYSTHACRNGREALAYYASHWRSTDLVVLDLMMPEMAGREAYLAMRDISPSVPVLIASGFSFEGEAERLMEAGARGFLQKPFRKSELAAKVAEVLSVTRVQASPGPA